MIFHLITIAALQKIMEAFCWMLVHSLWQGLIFAIVSMGVLMITKKSAATVRYTLICILFFGFAAVAGLTFLVEWRGVSTSGFSIYDQSLSSTSPLVSSIQQLFSGFSHFCSGYAPAIVLVWLIIVCGKSIGLARSLAYCNRIKHHRHFQTDEYWSKRIIALRDKLGITKKVLLLESTLIKVPIVLGHFKPIIFLPAGLIMNIPADQVEAVLLHELAHIRRNDYAVNLFQNIVEHVFFFNPALLWMSALLREEREHCCDDIALTQTGSKKHLIEALITFKEYALQSPAFAPAFPGRKNHLLNRVTRIVYNKNKTLTPVEKTFFFTGITAIAMLLFTVGNHSTNRTWQPAPINNTTAAFFEKSNDASPSAENTNTVPKKSDIQHSFKGNIVAELEPIVMDDEALSAITEDQHTDETLPDGTEEEKMNADEMIAYNNKLQAEADQFQVIKDKEQAMLDYIQSEKDMKQAAADRMKADELRQIAEDQKFQLVLQHKEEAAAHKQILLQKEMEKKLSTSLQKRN